MKAATYRFYRHCTIDEDGIMTCHAGSGSELNISEEVFEFRLRDIESLYWMMRKARLEGRKRGLIDEKDNKEGLEQIILYIGIVFNKIKK